MNTRKENLEKLGRDFKLLAEIEKINDDIAKLEELKRFKESLLFPPQTRGEIMEREKFKSLHRRRRNKDWFDFKPIFRKEKK
mgnify:CR=1 FL=1